MKKLPPTFIFIVLFAMSAALGFGLVWMLSTISVAAHPIITTLCFFSGCWGITAIFYFVITYIREHL